MPDTKTEVRDVHRGERLIRQYVINGKVIASFRLDQNNPNGETIALTKGYNTASLSIVAQTHASDLAWQMERHAANKAVRAVERHEAAIKRKADREAARKAAGIPDVPAGVRVLSSSTATICLNPSGTKTRRVTMVTIATLYEAGPGNRSYSLLSTGIGVLHPTDPENDLVGYGVALTNALRLRLRGLDYDADFDAYPLEIYNHPNGPLAKRVAAHCIYSMLVDEQHPNHIQGKKRTFAGVSW